MTNLSQQSILNISNLNKKYNSGLHALKDINLSIKKGEIFALLGPNGAGKTTLISTVCGIVNPSSGIITVGGFNIISEFRKARSLVGLVPQELTTDAFETVWNTVSFSRGLFGKPKNPLIIENILKNLSLWNKKDSKLMTLSGGMKRRVMIAKALSHEPSVLFLDEPSAGVDVELRQNMWEQVYLLKNTGVTIVLTTHYIEEAEKMADRIGIIRDGELILTEDKNNLIKKLGEKKLKLELQHPLHSIPSLLSKYDLKLSNENLALTLNYDTKKENNIIEEFLELLKQNNIHYKDLNTTQSSLEEIFMKLVKKQ